MRIVYVLTSDGQDAYLAMLRISAASVRLFNPTLRISVVTDPVTEVCFRNCGVRWPDEIDEIVVRDTPELGAGYRSRHLKTLVMSDVRGPALLLDCDTIVSGDISPVFQSCGDVDVDVAAAPNHSADAYADQLWDGDTRMIDAMKWEIGTQAYFNAGVVY
jgi:hypothetical protein